MDDLTHPAGRILCVSIAELILKILRRCVDFLLHDAEHIFKR